jgi:hypothetical protein
MQDFSLESLVKPHEEILIAALLGGEKPLGWYVRKGMPVPTEETWKQMIVQVQILMSMVKDTKGYLGKFEHVCVQHEFGVVYLFPVGMQKVLCIVTQPEPENKVVSVVKQFLA